MQTMFTSLRGFAFLELTIGFLIVLLLIGAILGGAQLIKNVKIRTQIDDLQALYAAVYTYFDRFLQMPGDANADGYFDTDSSVWNDIENHQLAYESKRSPFGTRYYFGADTSATPRAYRNGNYILVCLPVDVAENIDQQLDDGINTTGVVTSSGAYTGTGRTDVYFFID